MKFYFAKRCELGAHGSVKQRTALCLKTDGINGTLKSKAVSLVRIKLGHPDVTLFRIGVSLFQWKLNFFVHGSVVPSLRKPFGIDNLEGQTYNALES